jgi:hypothetical protein
VRREARRMRRVVMLLFTREKRSRLHTATDQIKINRKRPTPTPAIIQPNNSEP